MELTHTLICEQEVNDWLKEFRKNAQASMVA